MRIKSSVLVTLVVAVIAGGLLTGCAGGAGDGNAQPGESMSSSPPSASSPGPPPSSPAAGSGSGQATPPPNRSPGELTLTGQPEEGVEAGCLILRSGGQQYLLLGGDRQLLTSGRAVVVRGRPDPTMMTTCQQGTPFMVTEVRAAG